MNKWNELIILYPGANSGKFKFISLIFEKMGAAIYLVQKTLKSAVS